MAAAPAYKQKVMMQCLVKRGVGFAYSFGALPAIPARRIPRDRTDSVSGAIVFNGFRLRRSSAWENSSSPSRPVLAWTRRVVRLHELLSGGEVAELLREVRNLVIEDI